MNTFEPKPHAAAETDGVTAVPTCTHPEDYIKLYQPDKRKYAPTASLTLETCSVSQSLPDAALPDKALKQDHS